MAGFGLPLLGVSWMFWESWLIGYLYSFLLYPFLALAKKLQIKTEVAFKKICQGGEQTILPCSTIHAILPCRIIYTTVVLERVLNLQNVL